VVERRSKDTEGSGDEGTTEGDDVTEKLIGHFPFIISHFSFFIFHFSNHITEDQLSPRGIKWKMSNEKRKMTNNPAPSTEASSIAS